MTSSVPPWRLAAGVSAGLAGCAGSGGAVPMRTSLPAVAFGNRVTGCEKPGVAPSTELVGRADDAVV